MPRETEECNPSLKGTKLWLTQGFSPDPTVDTAATPSSCHWYSLGHVSAAEKTPHKYDGIYVAE